MTKNGWCRFCSRMGSNHCRNTRDMDPVDGFNFDPECHKALLVLGGGERGWVADDFKPRALKASTDKETR